VTVEVPVAETDANVNPPIVGRHLLGVAVDRGWTTIEQIAGELER